MIHRCFTRGPLVRGQMVWLLGCANASFSVSFPEENSMFSSWWFQLVCISPLIYYDILWLLLSWSFPSSIFAEPLWGYPCLFFHPGLFQSERQQVLQDAWSGACQSMVCSSHFMRGIETESVNAPRWWGWMSGRCQFPRGKLFRLVRMVGNFGNHGYGAQ